MKSYISLFLLNFIINNLANRKIVNLLETLDTWSNLIDIKLIEKVTVLYTIVLGKDQIKCESRRGKISNTIKCIVALIWLQGAFYLSF